MVVELRNVSKVYELPESGISYKVLSDISLLISPSESIAVTGPSGSGKSTLLNLMGTLDIPSSGQILLNDRLPDYSRDEDLASIRNRYIGFVFQAHHLLPQLTLLENILLPTLPLKDGKLQETANELALELLKKMGLDSRVHHRPSQLSIGECQRTAVIRALINRPQLLLADEPTGSLDQENASLLVNLLLDLQKEFGFALVMVTHSNELAARLKKVYRLSSGVLTLVTN